MSKYLLVLVLAMMIVLGPLSVRSSEPGHSGRAGAAVSQTSPAQDGRDGANMRASLQAWTRMLGFLRKHL